MKHVGGEEHDEQRPDHEVRYPGEEERAGRTGVVERSVAAQRGIGADGDRQGDRDERRQSHEEQRVEDAVAEEVHDRLAVGVRVARVAGEQPAEPVGVLLDRRLVEAELRPLGGEALLGRLAAEDPLGRVARQRLGEGEHDHRHDEQRQDPKGDPPENELQQAHVLASAGTSVGGAFSSRARCS